MKRKLKIVGTSLIDAKETTCGKCYWGEKGPRCGYFDAPRTVLKRTGESKRVYRCLSAEKRASHD